MKVLIAYATKYGATRDIAERVQQVLGRAGVDARAQAAEDVTSVQAYDAVVIGSGVYWANWLPEAVELLESFQEELAAKPVWLFSDGPTNDEASFESSSPQPYPERLQPVIEVVRPQDVALFGGKVDGSNLSLEYGLSNRSLRAVTRDERDWDTVEAWAAGIARSLTEAGEPLIVEPG